MRIKKDYIILYIVGILFCFPFLAPHYSLDTYTLLSGNYVDYANHFMKAGRIFSSLSYRLFDAINLPYNTLSVLSTFISILFITISIIELYKMIDKFCKIKKYKILIYGCLFAIFYNFCTIELFVFMESFIMFLGIMLIIFSLKFYFNEKKNISLILLLLSGFCYQGILCIYLPLFIILAYLKEKNFKNILNNIIKACFFYMLTLISNYIMLKFLPLILPIGNEEKISNIMIFKNLSITINHIKNTLWDFHGIYSKKYFYITSFLILILYLKDYKKTNLKDYFMLIFIMLACILTSFVPNVVMSTETNYTAAIMTISVGMIIPIAIMYYMCINKFKLSKNNSNYLIIVSLFYIFTLLSCYNKNMIALQRTDFNNYKYVQKYNEQIIKIINNKKIKINNIYLCKDSYVAYHYESELIKNGFTFKGAAFDWASPALFKRYLTIEHNNVIYDDSIISKFKQKENDKFNKNLIIEEDGDLYLLLY